MDYEIEFKIFHIRGLRLSNGEHWAIAGIDNISNEVVQRLEALMPMSPIKSSISRLFILLNEPLFEQIKGKSQELGLLGAIELEYLLDYMPQHTREQLAIVQESLVNGRETIACILRSKGVFKDIKWRLMQTTRLMALRAELKGALLLHGGLVEFNGNGIILSAPGGTGKTTAIKRLPPSWIGLCDDITLVIPVENKGYFAHPWITWKDLCYGKFNKEARYDHGVPLKAIFFLKQDSKISIEAVGTARSACMVTEAAEQANWGFQFHRKSRQLLEFRTHRFENICKFAKSVPCYILSLNLEAPFWNEIERVIET